MPPAEPSNLVGFFSYSRDDDQHLQGALSRLRERIQGELRVQLGRPIDLWQDKVSIAFGTVCNRPRARTRCVYPSD